MNFYKRSNGWLRNMKTTQERRMSFCDQCKEYNIVIRGKRTKRMLPNAWDDYPISNNQKGWKYLTKQKNQYRLK